MTRGFLSSLVFGIIDISYSYGRYLSHLSLHQREAILKYGIVGAVFLQLSSCTSEFSVCLLILRLLKNIATIREKSLLYSLMAVMVIGNAINIITLSSVCRSIANNAFAGCRNPKAQESLGYMQAGLSKAFTSSSSALTASQESWSLQLSRFPFSLCLS